MAFRAGKILSTEGVRDGLSASDWYSPALRTFDETFPDLGSKWHSDVSLRALLANGFFRFRRYDIKVFF
jgi:hypothetical protein